MNIDKKNKDEGETVTEEDFNDRNKNPTTTKVNIPFPADANTAETTTEYFSDTANMCSRRGGKDKSKDSADYKASATTSRGILLEKQLPKTTHPGALSVFPGGIVTSIQSLSIGTTFVHGISTAQLTTSIEASDIETPQSNEAPVNAFIVYDSCELAHVTATIIDIEKERIIHGNLQTRRMLLLFITTIVIAIIVAVT